MEIKDWTIRLDMRDESNAHACIDGFARLAFGNLTYHSFEAFNESCRISGFVYGHKKYADGTEIGTSCVRLANRLEGDVLEITTQSGSKYLLKIDEMNQKMKQLLLEVYQRHLYTIAGRTGYEESYT